MDLGLPRVSVGSGFRLSAKGAQGLRLNISARYCLIFILGTLRRQVIVVVFLLRSITPRGVINCFEQPKALHRAGTSAPVGLGDLDQVWQPRDKLNNKENGQCPYPAGSVAVAQSSTSQSTWRIGHSVTHRHPGTTYSTVQYNGQGR